MIRLLDVNLLIALSWPSHVHHGQARRWFGKVGRKGWASCPLTQTAFIRICSNPKFIDGAVDPKQALLLFRELSRRTAHTFWPDDLDLTAGDEWPDSYLIGHRQVTDAYLLGLAIRHHGRLATLDSGVQALLPNPRDREKSLEVVETLGA